MKKRLLLLAGLALLVLSLGGLSCARVFPPAGAAVGPRPTPAIQPPPVPHSLPGQGDCLACHSSDERFLASLQVSHPVPLPPGFTGSTSEACQLCHTMEAGHATASSIPHPVKGMEACLTCHGSGMAGISQIPPSHSGYDIQKCTGCHAPAAP